MTDEEIAKDLLENRSQSFCDRRLFAFVNRALNRFGLMAHVTKIDSEIWFEVVHKEDK